MGRLKPFGYRSPGYYRSGAKRDKARMTALYRARKRRSADIISPAAMTPLPLVLLTIGGISLEFDGIPLEI